MPPSLAVLVSAFVAGNGEDIGAGVVEQVLQVQAQAVQAAQAAQAHGVVQFD